ncbi:APC family permease [Nocardioides kongjuensis]|uniref:Amino acid transporter n=1 Tax=Nocardioides kongjuensis TaxID=349522 RepID=A0A852RML5_9ACTN|nr:APC family permease [Nocardioides kongjuensis]NYD31929.1 amino acid transporter [Nocardioides kongjuensis]
MDGADTGSGRTLEGDPVAARLRSSSPVGGLSRRTLAFPQVLAQSVAAVAPSAVMVTLPLLAHPTAGSLTPVVFLAVAALMVAVARCVNAFATRMVAPGGLYSYTVKGLGPRAGLVAGLSLVIGYAGAAAASVLGAAEFLLALLDDLGLDPDPATARPLACLAVAAAAGAVMVRGVRLSAGAVLVVEALAISTVVVVLTVAGWTDLRIDAGLGSSVAEGHWGLVLLLAMVAFVGFESATTLSSETRRPFSAVPRAVRWTPVVTGLLFAGAALLVTRDGFVGAGGSGMAWDLSGGGGAVPRLVEGLLHVGVLGSWFACACGSTTALTRTLFTMAREGVLPAPLGRTHRRWRTPALTLTVASTLVGAAVAATTAVGVAADELFVWLLALSAQGYVVAYVFCVVAAPVFLHRIGELPRAGWLVPTLTATAMAGIVVAGTALDPGRFSRPAVVYLALLASGLVLTLIRLRARGVRLAALGLYDETTEADLLTRRRTAWRGGEHG